MSNAASVLRTAHVFLSSALTVYLGISLFSIFVETTRHYAIFVGGAVLLSSLTIIINALVRMSSRGGIVSWAYLLSSLIFFVSGLVTSGYLTYHAIRLETCQPFITNTDVWVGSILVLTVLYIILMRWGLLITSVISLAVLYFLVGDKITVPVLASPYYDKYFILSYFGMSLNTGLFWLASLAADKIYFIIIFSNMLRSSGVVNLYLEFGKLTGRWMKGGAAAPAYIGSALTGMVTGESVSNVALTGRFTIPAMMKHGFHPAFAGAVESTASSSGQIMPPILGLAAFIMSAILNIPYLEVAFAALLPAFLYLFGVGFTIWTKAKVDGVSRMTDPVDIRLILRLMPTFLLSFGLLLLLLIYYYSPGLAGFAATIAVLILIFFQREYRPNFRKAFVEFNEGNTMLMDLCILLIAIGLLAQTVITTNITGRMSEILTKVLPNSEVILVIGTAFAALFAGMGLPTPAAYTMVGLVVAPFIQELGVPALVAHFYIFYYATMSTITPPIATSCMAACKISGASFVRTCTASMKIAASTAIVPLMFVFNPSILQFPNVSTTMAFWVFMCLSIQVCIVLTTHGFIFRRLSVIERAVFGVSALLGFLFAIYHWKLLFWAFAVFAGSNFLWVMLSARSYKKKWSGARDRALSSQKYPKNHPNEN